jgi:hypothetical protein
MGEQGLGEYTRDVDPVTDNHPYMAYSKSLHFLSTQDPRIYDDMLEVWNYLDEAERPLLEDYLALMEIIYHEEAYLETSNAWMRGSSVRAARHHYHRLLAQSFRSGYLEHFLGQGLVQELRR